MFSDRYQQSCNQLAGTLKLNAWNIQLWAFQEDGPVAAHKPFHGYMNTMTSTSSFMLHLNSRHPFPLQLHDKGAFPPWQSPPSLVLAQK
jgi:hypothetical protein